MLSASHVKNSWSKICWPSVWAHFLKEHALIKKETRHFYWKSSKLHADLWSNLKPQVISNIFVPMLPSIAFVLELFSQASRQWFGLHFLSCNFSWSPCWHNTCFSWTTLTNLLFPRKYSFLSKTITSSFDCFPSHVRNSFENGWVARVQTISIAMIVDKKKIRNVKQNFDASVPENWKRATVTSNGTKNVSLTLFLHFATSDRRLLQPTQTQKISRNPSWSLRKSLLLFFDFSWMDPGTAHAFSARYRNSSFFVDPIVSCFTFLIRIEFKTHSWHLPHDWFRHLTHLHHVPRSLNISILCTCTSLGDEKPPLFWKLLLQLHISHSIHQQWQWGVHTGKSWIYLLPHVLCATCFHDSAIQGRSFVGQFVFFYRWHSKCWVFGSDRYLLLEAVSFSMLHFQALSQCGNNMNLPQISHNSTAALPQLIRCVPLFILQLNTSLLGATTLFRWRFCVLPHWLDFCRIAFLLHPTLAVCSFSPSPTSIWASVVVHRRHLGWHTIHSKANQCCERSLRLLNCLDVFYWLKSTKIGGQICMLTWFYLLLLVHHSLGRCARLLIVTRPHTLESLHGCMVVEYAPVAKTSSSCPEKWLVWCNPRSVHLRQGSRFGQWRSASAKKDAQNVVSTSPRHVTGQWCVWIMTRTKSRDMQFFVERRQNLRCKERSNRAELCAFLKTMFWIGITLLMQISWEWYKVCARKKKSASISSRKRCGSMDKSLWKWDDNVVRRSLSVKLVQAHRLKKEITVMTKEKVFGMQGIEKTFELASAGRSLDGWVMRAIRAQNVKQQNKQIQFSWLCSLLCDCRRIKGQRWTCSNIHRIIPVYTVTTGSAQRRDGDTQWRWRTVQVCEMWNKSSS